MPNHKYNIGDTVYFVESQRIIREVKIIKCGSGFYTMKFVDGSGGIRLRENRLFSTKEEAEKFISKTPPTPTPQRKNVTVRHGKIKFPVCGNVIKLIPVQQLKKVPVTC